MSSPPTSMTNRSKQACRPERTPLSISVSPAEAVFAREPQVMPQNEAAWAGTVRTRAVSAVVRVRMNSRTGVRFMAGLLGCAKARIRRHARHYHRQVTTVKHQFQRVVGLLLPSLTVGRAARMARCVVSYVTLTVGQISALDFPAVDQDAKITR